MAGQLGIERLALDELRDGQLGIEGTERLALGGVEGTERLALGELRAGQLDIEGTGRLALSERSAGR